MGRLFSPSFCRFLATVLLVLDLSQEPLSALPSPTPGDSDDDMVTEIATHDEFWWFGSARPGPEFNLALAAEHASALTDQLPPKSPTSIASATVTKAVAIPQAASRHSALATPAHVACPEPPSIRNIRALTFNAPHHRNTVLGHRASVLLLI